MPIARGPARACAYEAPPPDPAGLAALSFFFTFQ
jgi:hypothetical protein